MKYISAYANVGEEENQILYSEVVNEASNDGFVGVSYYIDPETGYKTKPIYVHYVESMINPDYIVSYNKRHEVIGILRKESLLKGNDSRLKNGRNYCKSVEAQINKLLMPPEPDAKVKGKLKIIVEYLQSLIND